MPTRQNIGVPMIMSKNKRNNDGDLLLSYNVWLSEWYKNNHPKRRSKK